MSSDDEQTKEEKRRQRNKRIAVWWFSAALHCAADSRILKCDREQSGAEYITEILRGHAEVVQANYRLTPANFRLLGDELLARGLQCGGDLIIEEHVGMFMQLVAQGATIRKLCLDFQHSEETVSRSLREVITALLRMIPEYMKLPQSDEPIHPKLREGTDFYPFKGALGAIDGTHIPAFPDSHETFKERWRNRKGQVTQNVMAAVDFNGNFLTVVSGWEGSAHDALVLRRAIDDGFTVPEGRYYLVDAGYANTHQFLSPYRGKTYHLAQFRQRSAQNRYGSAEELYNHRHAQLRNVVEKAFGILKGRFRILRDMHKYKYHFQAKLVIAFCVLHNFINRHQSVEVDFEEAASESDDSDDSDSDAPSTSANVSRGTDAQRGGGALKESIRDMFWNARRMN
ncbi:nuclease [Rhynchospora pubera]|uniref:Nuclease n=1 Tax=Rhynchospora pubera TaxID=906938 RepID=A0AAV8EPN9_9POAL|nr:nuclease [Rhynchospora pubera]